MPGSVPLLLFRSATGIYSLALVFAAVAFARQAAGLARVASGVLVAGVALHVASLCGELSVHGFPLFTTPLSITSGFSLCGVVVGYVLALRFELRQSLGLLVAVPFVISLAALGVDPDFAPFGSRLDGFAIQLHLVAVMVAYACFAVGASLGGMLLIRVRALKERRLGFWSDVMPPLVSLERATVACLGAGFLALSVSTGLAVYHVVTKGWLTSAKGAKALLSLGVWVYYAVVMAGRVRRGWHGERIAVLAVVGGLVAFLAFVLMQAAGRSS